MLKRITDWLEKVSVIALGVGLFQDKTLWGLFVAGITLVACLMLTRKQEGKK
jgi:biopolymer transport protein ExbB/TolQ